MNNSQMLMLFAMLWLTSSQLGNKLRITMFVLFSFLSLMVKMS